MHNYAKGEPTLTEARFNAHWIYYLILTFHRAFHEPFLHVLQPNRSMNFVFIQLIIIKVFILMAMNVRMWWTIVNCIYEKLRSLSALTYPLHYA